MALLLDVPPVRVAWLMGHASRDMIDRVYGAYRDGMEEDRDRWRGYFGEDFR